MTKAFCILVEVVDRDIVCQTYNTYPEAFNEMLHRINTLTGHMSEDEYDLEIDSDHGIAWLNDKKHDYHYDWQIFIREI